MDKDTRRLSALLTNPIDNNNNNDDNNDNNPDANNANNADTLNTEDHVNQSIHVINTLVASPENTSTSDSSSKPVLVKPQRRRNKPSLSCETCTVSHSYSKDQMLLDFGFIGSDTYLLYLTLFRLKKQRWEDAYSYF